MDRDALLLLWSRRLGGETLSDEEQAGLRRALEADAVLRRELLEDEALHGFLLASGRGAVEGEGAAFSRMFLDYAARQQDGRSFADRVSRRIQEMQEAGRGEAAAIRPSRGASSSLRLRAIPRAGRFRRLAPAIAAAGLLAALGVAVLLRPPLRRPGPAAPLPAPAVARATEGPPAVPAIAGLVDAGPGVRFVRDGVEAPAGRRLDLQSGDRLRVPAGAAAAIRYADGTQLNAGPGCDLTLEGGAGRAKRVTLAAGPLVADVARQPAGLPMVVVTPQAEITVLGTSFSLAVEGDATRLDVMVGTVRLAQPAAGRSVEVGAGQFVVAAPGAPPLVRWRAADTHPPDLPERPEEPEFDYAAAPALHVRLGETIPRAWAQVRADGYAWGPRQSFDAAAGETLVYLPYGRDLARYARARGVVLYDPRPGTPAKLHSRGADADAELAFQLRFDRPIGAFRFEDNWSEIHLGPGGEAGAEYSVDGKAWVAMRVYRGEDGVSGIHEPFVGRFEASGLDTRRLLIRYYARAPRAAAPPGPGRWLQIWMAGDPGWGDVATTFFERQLQVRVKPSR